MKSFIGTLLRMAFGSMLISLLLTLINWPFYRGDDFRFGMRFLSGAAVIFVAWFVASIISTIVELSRFRKEPRYKNLRERTGISWKDYKKFKGIQR